MFHAKDSVKEAASPLIDESIYSGAIYDIAVRIASTSNKASPFLRDWPCCLLGSGATVYKNADVLLVSDSISWLESYLPKGKLLRVQRSFFVNVSKITMLDAKTLWIGETKISVELPYRESVQQVVMESIFNVSPSQTDEIGPDR